MNVYNYGIGAVRSESRLLQNPLLGGYDQYVFRTERRAFAGKGLITTAEVVEAEDYL